uniref:Ig-like domain-containing protein n=1 Tax=Esox lucius TaxID=8010 RepID=A0AAY5L212_ESOLU
MTRIIMYHLYYKVTVLVSLLLYIILYQSPSMILVKPDAPSTLNCSHKIPSYYTILWYHRSVGDTALKLIGYSYYKTPDVEPTYKGYFNVSGDGSSEAPLVLLKPRLTKDSGEYFCAASYAQCFTTPSLLYKNPTDPL